MDYAKRRISKDAFYRRGGFANMYLFRSMRNGRWMYWERVC